MFTVSRREGLKRQSARHSCLALWFLLFGLLAPSSQAESVRLLISSDQSYYREAQHSFIKTLKTLAPNVSVSASLLDSSTEHNLSQAWSEDLIVTIGTPSAKFTSQSLAQEKTIALFITRDVFLDLTSDLTKPGFKAALALDQSPDRLLLLARLLLPEARTLATVTGPISASRLPAVQEAADNLGFTVSSTILGEKDNPVATLSLLIKDSDVFLALPDNAVFNRSIAKWALYLGFRAKVPVIGFSKAYSDAGALASIYTSPEDIGRQGAELVAQSFNEPDTFQSGLHYPHYYTLQSNSSVAQALKITLPEDSALYQQYAEALTNNP